MTMVECIIVVEVREVGPSEWQCWEAASVAEGLTARSGNNVGFIVLTLAGEDMGASDAMTVLMGCQGPVFVLVCDS